MFSPSRYLQKVFCFRNQQGSNHILPKSRKLFRRNSIPAWYSLRTSAVKMVLSQIQIMNRLGREPVHYVSKLNRLWYEIRHIQSNLDQRRLLKTKKVQSNNKLERCFVSSRHFLGSKSLRISTGLFELENNVSNTPKGRFILLS